MLFEEFDVLFLLRLYEAVSLYPLFIRYVASAPERILKKLSVEQILLSRNAMLNGMDCWFSVRYVAG